MNKVIYVVADQPFNCPYCGLRTVYISNNKEKCMECNKIFNIESEF